MQGLETNAKGVLQPPLVPATALHALKRAPGSLPKAPERWLLWLAPPA